ncbi:MAG: aminotransferase class I/II-fold pyridoxal phosphate-dependent enzyme, partial [Myxococcota bacterium]|nr:aminotransferase class I/II-fold pyridoxal phosphate-dependent enzyme [Myxococcota bacterium]
MGERRPLQLRGRAQSTHPDGAAGRPAPNPPVDRDQGIIRVAEPLIGPQEAARVAEVVASTLVSSVSPAVAQFERSLAARCGASDAIAVTCGTHALDLLMYALDVGPGDEVIVPALTFISVGAAVAKAGARPVFVDVSRDTLNMTADSAAAAVTERTRGIIGVHTYGHPCDMEALDSVAEEHGLFLLEDACEALGASLRGRPVGGLGDVAVHSFYSN